MKNKIEKLKQLRPMAVETARELYHLNLKYIEIYERDPDPEESEFLSLVKSTNAQLKKRLSTNN